MYIESRIYDNGNCEMKLHDTKKKPEIKQFDTCDCYIDRIHDLMAWLSDNLCIETYEQLGNIIDDLNSGGWVDVTCYC